MEQLTLGWVLLASTLFGTAATGSRRDVRAITEKVMDMAWDSFDDQYQDCSCMMEKLKTVNLTEFQNEVYADTWGKAAEHWQSQWGNSNNQQVLPQEQAVAVLAYTDIGNLSKQLNEAMLEGGRSRDYYLQSFPFKTLHFLLTKALHTLWEAQGHSCHRVYRGVNGTRYTAKLKETVRFGQFASASLNENIAKGFGNDTLFFVNTCYGVSIESFSFDSEQKEVLIPPYEVFKVINVTRYTNGTHIYLQSTGANSTYNCALLNATGSRRDVRAITEKVMDMAWDSFDDQYQGCSRMMEEKLKTVNLTEFQNKTYADTWRKAAEHWQKQWGNSNCPQVLPQEQAVAVLAYTDGGHLYKQFNTLVREGGRSREHYLESFPFKTLHFLLTEAVHTLQKTQSPKCNSVYRGIKGIRFTAQLNQTVRFGQFASASFNKNIAQEFGQDTLFFVNTCYGVSIRNFSFYPEQEEVLIPPYEVFKVTKVIRCRDTTHIHLDSHSTHSTYNCTLVNATGSRRDVCAITEKVMDMAPYSFDDQYQDCSRMMEEKLETVNLTEFQNEVYADTWTKAAEYWQNQWGNSNRPQVLPQEQAVAVLAYTDGGHLYKQFNTLVREGGRSREHYLQHFPFKTLHFLLTEAVHTLQKTQSPKCNRVYRGIKGIRFTAQLHQTVRFGQFASASFNKNIAQDFGTDTLFFVNTCYGVSIRSFSFYPEQEEVLIPPYEVFKVTKVICYTDGTHIHLDSHSRHSNYSCALLNGTSSPREPPHLWRLLLVAAVLAAVGCLCYKCASCNLRIVKEILRPASQGYIQLLVVSPIDLLLLLIW